MNPGDCEDTIRVQTQDEGRNWVSAANITHGAPLIRFVSASRRLRVELLSCFRYSRAYADGFRAEVNKTGELQCRSVTSCACNGQVLPQIYPPNDVTINMQIQHSHVAYLCIHLHCYIRKKLDMSHISLVKLGAV